MTHAEIKTLVERGQSTHDEDETRGVDWLLAHSLEDLSIINTAMLEMGGHQSWVLACIGKLAGVGFDHLMVLAKERLERT